MLYNSSLFPYMVLFAIFSVASLTALLNFNRGSTKSLFSARGEMSRIGYLVYNYIYLTIGLISGLTLVFQLYIDLFY